MTPLFGFRKGLGGGWGYLGPLYVRRDDEMRSEALFTLFYHGYNRKAESSLTLLVPLLFRQHSRESSRCSSHCSSSRYSSSRYSNSRYSSRHLHSRSSRIWDSSQGIVRGLQVRHRIRRWIRSNGNILIMRAG